jgi:hypothetical protein
MMSENFVKPFYCEKCDYNCLRKYDFDKHKMTSKHNKVDTENLTNVNKCYTCDNCNKNYSHRQGLSIHKKKCIKPKPTDEMLLSVIIDLVKTNTELTNKLKALEEASK